MSLSKKAIEEFEEIYKKEFGEEISDTQARDMVENLIELFKIIYRPLLGNKKRAIQSDGKKIDLSFKGIVLI
jgi:hypothetical protein